jgi:hypothetical protein
MAVNLDFDDEEILSAWARGDIDENDERFSISVQEATKKTHKRKKRELPPPILTPTQQRFQILDSEDQHRNFDLEEFKEELKKIANNQKKTELTDVDTSYLIYWNKAVRSMLTMKKLGHQVRELIFLNNFLKLFWNESFNPEVYVRKYCRHCVTTF